MAGQLGDMDYLWYPGVTGDVPMRPCPNCNGGRCLLCAGLGYDVDDMGQPCEWCDGTGVCEVCEGEGEIACDGEGDEP